MPAFSCSVASPATQLPGHYRAGDYGRQRPGKDMLSALGVAKRCSFGLCHVSTHRERRRRWRRRLSTRSPSRFWFSMSSFACWRPAASSTAHSRLKFRRVSSATSAALAAFRNSTISTAGSLDRQAKARHGKPERALEEDKGWDPLLLFPRGVWTAMTIRKFCRVQDHKPACLHHNPVHADIGGAHEIAISWR